MITHAIALFALAAVVGLSMAIGHFRGRTPPRPLVATLHGAFAASGLLVLLLSVVQAGTRGAVAIALCLFLLAALGGFTLLSLHLRGRKLPNLLVAGHGLLAVSALVVLLAAHPAQDTAVRHMLWMGASWILFVFSLAARGYPGSGPPPWWATLAALAGFAITAFGGWLGGQLVYRFGVGQQQAGCCPRK